LAIAITGAVVNPLPMISGHLKINALKSLKMNSWSENNLHFHTRIHNQRIKK
jgi:hypothetical protein